MSEIPFEFPIIVEEQFKYQEISAEAKRLRKLGMSYRRIGDVLGVDDKTVRKACSYVIQLKG